ncbi:cyclohexanone monooxygenase [Litorimonas cladophorae]|uniref:Cyclohexanone monooxygenase n=1 Tax=Litorimonas cladophorae TaxID=1220491 RepID=A0A918KQI4_9PROT|nr:NAD(P)/FAD-dependent oxidoreductase [Litorimonas cladophorae]GGX71986.1 cyclohexanone monooxygenase [Litorimonas cladophorae]
MTEHFDTLIVGAGLSGIGAAVHHRRDCPNRSFVILEARERMGGTWDLFRYPGIRSDSDMHTLGYDFKPWTDGKAIADGPSILRYIKETAAEYGIEDHIRYNAKVKSIDWNSDAAHWVVTHADASGATTTLTANFIISAAGYYRYEEGYNPHFEGREDFKGDIIHPQHWPEDYDTSGIKIVVIGSGATAVTLIPSLAPTAVHVTMLQRSPTWIASRPDTDWVANFLRKILPEKTAYKISRAKNIAYSRYVYNMAQRKPKKTGDYLLKQIRKELGEDFDVETHFTPSYNPWDQRLCLVPNSDLFKAMKAGQASVVTDHIERFVPEGILLKSGKILEADLIVTATGLNVVAAGETEIAIDGVVQTIGDKFGYHGLMFSDIPNMVSIFGYTNASWTLRADLISRFSCRLMNYLDANGLDTVTPHAPDDLIPRQWVDFSAGYITRVADKLPKQGDRDPWQNRQDYKFDKEVLMKSALEGDGLIFSSSTAMLEAAE